MREFRIWLKYTNNSFQQVLSNRGLVIIFLSGKLLRIFIFVAFLGFIFQGASSIGNYSREQIIFFYLSFNLIDTIAQFFFREVYRFRPLVISGNLDFVFLKPLNPLVRVLLGGADVMDLLMILILLIFTFSFAMQNFSLNPANIIIFILLVFNGLLISAAFHIVVLALGVMTTSVDHLIMIYRDLASMMRIPVDLYVEPIKFLLTFVMPLGIMITIPSKALIGLLSWESIFISLIFGVTSIYLSIKCWSFSIKRYTSASS